MKLSFPPSPSLSAAISPVNFFRNGLRRRRAAVLALSLLALGAAWNSPAAKAQAVDFGSVNVCPPGATTPAPCSKTLTLTFNIAAGTTIGSVHYLTLGAQNLDFKAEANDTSTGLCSAKTYSSATTCAVDVTFAPIAPGQRKGAVEILDGSGNILARNLIDGTAAGPAIAFNSAAVDFLGSGFDFAYGVAVDGSGDVLVGVTSFATTPLVGSVQEMLAVNGSIPLAPAINTLGTGFVGPSGVAVDGSGNVYVADGYDNAIKEILAVNGKIPANPVISVLGGTPSFALPFGVAVDGRGNVYVADTLNSAVKEILAVNGSIPEHPTINTLGSGFKHPDGVGVDASGNVYVADTANVAVKEILAVNGSIPPDPTIKTLSTDFFPEGPTALALDAAGDIYLSGTGEGVLEILAANGTIPSDPTILNLYTDYNFGVAVDGTGNVFIADIETSRIPELPRSRPPSLSFLASVVGITSTDSPQSIQVQNIGNATLSLSGLAVSGDFALVPGSGNPADCTPGSSLTPGAWCNLSISFTPERDGPLTGTLTLSDNALNAAGATQKITLSGTGLPLFQKLAVSPNSLAFGSLTYGESKLLELQVTNAGSLPVTVTPVISGPSFVTPPSSNGCPTVLPVNQSCSLAVNFAPRTFGTHADTLTFAGVPAPTVTLTGQTIGVGPTTGLLVFGTIPYGTTAILPLTIMDYGMAGPVTLSTSINGPSFKILTESNACLSGVTYGGTCALQVEFSPAAVGGHGDVLTITPSAGAASTVKLYGIASQP